MVNFGIAERLREFLTSRRFLWAVITVVGLVGILYLLFISFFFDPYEEDLGDMASVVPREVDYFVRWKGAGERFDGFPVPELWGYLESSQVWKEMQRSGADVAWDESLGVSEVLKGMESAHKFIPAELSLESDLLREVAIAGHGKFGLNADFNGVLMLRVSFKVKAGVALLNFDFVRDKLPASLGIESLGNGRYRIPQFGPFGMQDAYLSRINDVVLLASRPEWLDTAKQLNDNGGEDSLALASQFSDNVEAYLAPGDQTVEVFFRWEKMKNQFPRWPGNKSRPGALERIAGGFFDSEIMRFVSGYWLPGQRFDLRFSGDVDPKRARNDFLRSWVNSGLVSVNRIKQFAGASSAKSFFFSTVGGDPRKVLIQLQAGLDPEFRRLLDEILVETRFNGLPGLLNELGLAFEPGLALSLRRNDFASTGDQREVEHDETPVPLFALMGKLRDRSVYQDLLEFFLNNAYRFSDNSNQVKLMKVDLRGGTSATSFTSPAIPGTGEFLVFEIPSLKSIVICNSFRYMEEIVTAAFTTEQSRNASKIKLSKAPNFAPALAAQQNGANLFVWYDPSESWHWMEAFGMELARGKFQIQMEEMYRRERPNEIRRLKAELFPDQVSLSSADNRTLQAAVDDALSEKFRQGETDILPDMAAEALSNLLPLRWLDWVSVGLKTTRRRASLLVSGEMALD